MADLREIKTNWSKEKGNYTDESVLDFSASFDVVKPFNGDDYNLEDYFEGYVECLDKESKYDMCERFDCKPGNWQMNVQILMEDTCGNTECVYERCDIT